MKTLILSFLLGPVGLTVCQAQADTNRVHVPTDPTIIHLHEQPSLSNRKPLLIVQGKEVANVDKLNPNAIKSINVIGPKDPRRLSYGLKGQDGVIEIELKSDSTFQQSPKN